MAAQVHVLDLNTGTPRVVWCEKHLLPCGFEVDAYLLSESGVSRVFTVRGCIQDHL